MICGIKQTEGKCYCKACNEQLDIVLPTIFNYCPYCGAPLNIATANNVIEKNKSIKYKVIKELLGVAENPIDYMSIKRMTEKISKE